MEDSVIIAEQEVAKKERKKMKKAQKEAMTNEKILLSFERTHIAWIKAATHLLIFGFAIYKLLEAKVNEPGTHPVLEIITPRRIAVILFFGGILGLMMATLRSVEVQKKYGQYSWRYHFTAIMLLAYIILILLVLLFIGTLLGR